MKRWLWILAFVPSLAWGQLSYYGGSQFSSQITNSRGTPLSGSTVTVCGFPGVLISTIVTMASGCTIKATIYSDPGLNFVKANPFQADGFGNVVFYAPPGVYSYAVTGPTVNPTLYTTVLPCVVGMTNTCGFGGEGPHALLSETHIDTVPFTPPDIGGMIRSGLLNLWEHVIPGQLGDVWTLVPAGPNLIPVWADPFDLDTAEKAEVNDIFVGQESTFDFVAGQDIVISPSLSATTFDGAGLNDGVYSGYYDPVLCSNALEPIKVQIDGTGIPDTFKWYIGGALQASGVSITGVAQTLCGGLKITFGAAVGHTLNNSWSKAPYFDDSDNGRVRMVWNSKACTSVQVSGVEEGCEHEINFIPGTDIGITAVDNPGNSSVDVTINATGGGATVCDPNLLVTFYVDDAGNDTTGDGSIGNPWLTIQKAWNDGVPAAVGGTYIIQLKSPGTYSPPAPATETTLGGKTFFGYSFDETFCNVSLPCSLVKIVGDIAASETYLIDGAPTFVDTGAMNVFGVPVTFEGVTFANAPLGLAVHTGGRATLGAVSFINDNIGLMINPGGGVYLEQSTYVNDCIDAFADCDTIRFYNNVVNLPSAPFLTTSDFAIQINNGYLNDVCASFTFDTGVRTAIYDNGANASFSVGVEAQASSIVNLSSTLFIDGAVEAGSTGVVAFGSRVGLHNFTVDGASLGVWAKGGFVSGAPFSISSNFDINNATTGILLGGKGEVVDMPTFTAVTTKIDSDDPTSFFGQNIEKVPVTFAQLAGLVSAGAAYRCTDCDAPATPGAACSNAGPASEALAYYIRGGWKCY